jgi:hypothetical protein
MNEGKLMQLLINQGFYMKRLLAISALLLTAHTVQAQNIQFENLSKSDVENVAREFSANFAHTTVSAPETEGVWGIEVGIIGGRSGSPKLKDVVNASGGKGSDFENLYHAGLMARAHFPLDLFVELSLLPEREISDVKIKNHSFELGWNAGAFFGWPLDVALGVSFANSEISFTQDPTTNVNVRSTINLESQTRVLWIGASKTFSFVTPYLKLGTARSESDLKANADIFGYSVPDQKESVSASGGYLAAGANLQFGFFKLGAELSQVMNVRRATGKISLDF